MVWKLGKKQSLSKKKSRVIESKFNKDDEDKKGV